MNDILQKNDSIIVEDNNYIIQVDESNTELLKNEIFNNLKIENLNKILYEIKDKNIYQFAFSPEGGILKEYPDGTIGGVWRDSKNGRIFEHGRLKSVGPNIISLCNIVVNQMLIGAVLVQLNEVNEKLNLIYQGQHNDRIAEVEGAIKAYEDFKEKIDISQVILQLKTGIEKLYKELVQLTNGYSPKAEWGDNWLFGNNRKIERNNELYHKCQEIIVCIFKGYDTLLKIGNTLNKDIKNKNIESFIEFLNKTDWNKLYSISRGLKYKKNSRGRFPEQDWKEIINNKNLIEKNLKINKNIIYSIESNGKNIKEFLK